MARSPASSPEPRWPRPCWARTCSSIEPVATGIALLGAILLIVAGASVGGLVACALQLARAYAALSDKQRSFFGFCSGSRGAGADEPRSGEKLPLTDWLHQGINDLAGRRFGDAPLTIGDLHGKPPVDGRDASISFQMVTTNLSQAQPTLFPNDDRRLLFDEKDMARFFPASVVAHLKSHPPLPRRRNARPSADEVVVLPEGFHFLPAGGDLPVVVATRLSLSFPVLLSALRLYSIKGSAFRAARAYHDRTRGRFPLDVTRDLEENWFSDGGIAANFPLSIFDAWVPSRPTFGIDLRDAPTAGRVPRPAQAESVILPRAGDRDDTLARPAPIPDLMALFLAMLDTARSSRDNSQAAMASYRERVATVYLAPDEGGLNLGMSDQALAEIKKKGEKAGRLFVTQFSRDEHLWVRTRLLMSHLEEELAKVMRAHGTPGGSLAPLRDRYREIFAKQASLTGAARFYRPEEQPWCDEAEKRIEKLLVLVEQWHEAQAAWAQTHPDDPELFFRMDPPKPTGALRVTSPV